MLNNPFSELAAIVDGRVKAHAESTTAGAWLGAELGTMTDDMGLKLDRYKYVIFDYLVAHYLTLAEPDMTKTETDGGHSHPGAGYGGEHSNKVITPPPLLPLRPGDRVLVLPVNGGQDFVITARVVSRR